MKKTAQALQLAVYAAILLFSWGCSREAEDTLPALPELALKSVEPAVRHQLAKAFHAARQNPSSAVASGNLGMILHAYDQHEAAATCYKRAVALDPQEFRWAYYLGTADFLLGHDEEAAEVLHRANRLKPDYFPARLKLAQSLFSMGKLDEAEQVYRSIVTKESDSALAHYGLGRVISERDGEASAIKHYRRACEISPTFGAAHYALALASRAAGENEQSDSHFALYEKHRSAEQPLEDALLYQISELKRNPADDLFKRGLALADSGDLEKAAGEFEKALELAPDLVQARVNLITLYARLNRPKEVEKHYQDAAARQPAGTDLHFNFGLFLSEQQRFPEAEAAFRKALVADPSFAEAHGNLGQTLEAQGRFDEALKHYRQAIQHKPQYRLAHFHLGRALFAQGKTDEGLRHFLKTLTPEDQQTPKYMLDVAVAFARAGDRDKARHYAREAHSRATRLGQTEVTAMSENVLRKLGGPGL